MRSHLRWGEISARCNESRFTFTKWNIRFCKDLTRVRRLTWVGWFYSYKQLLKLGSVARIWRTEWCFQIFLMAIHLFLFIHDVLYAHIRQHKKCVAQKSVMSTKKIFYIEVNVAHQYYVSHKKICCGDEKKNMWHPKEDSRWLNV